jgi:hypothetical protein
MIIYEASLVIIFPALQKFNTKFYECKKFVFFLIFANRADHLNVILLLLNNVLCFMKIETRISITKFFMNINGWNILL